MAPIIRTQKMVTVSSSDAALTDNLRFYTNQYTSPKTNLTTQVEAPILNEYNLVFMEIYPERKPETKNYIWLPCKLNFMTICCRKNAVTEDIRYKFDDEYSHVKQVDFTGHIGSMRLAFDLLKKFKRCTQVVFVLNEYNVSFPNGSPDFFFNGAREYKLIECVRIITDNAETETEVAATDTKRGAWRLDEILRGCEECFPNLQKVEVCVPGSGRDFDRVKQFITAHPKLQDKYTVEITNGKVRTRAKVSLSYNLGAINFPSASSSSVPSSFIPNGIGQPTTTFQPVRVKIEKDMDVD